MELAEITAIVGVVGAALGLVVGLANMWNVLHSISISHGEIEIMKLRAEEQPALSKLKRGDGGKTSLKEAAMDARRTLKALSQVNATEYSRDKETRQRVDAALRRIEGQLRPYVGDRRFPDV